MKNKLNILYFITVLLVLMSGIGPATAVLHLYYKVLENTGPGFFVGNIHSSVQNGHDYKFENSSMSLCLEYFNLLSAGEIQTRNNIDREALVETQNLEELTCVVNYIDDEDTALSLIVTIEIEDLNDVVPTLFGLQHPVQNQTIYENLPIGQVIRYLMPYDLDKGLNGTVNYTIVMGNEEGYFELRSPISGDTSPDRLLILKKALDYEKNPQFNLTFNVSDKGSNPLMSYQYLIINVIDVNDEIPVFHSPSFVFTISETDLIGYDHPFGRINATDDDSATHAQIFYQLSDQSHNEYKHLFSVNITTGDLYLLQTIDYDSDETEYTIGVEARNPESSGGTNAEVRIVITDVNDEKPTLDKPLSFTITENSLPGVVLAIYTDHDQHSPNNEIANASLSFSPSLSYLTGPISGFNGKSFIIINITDTVDREETPFVILTLLVTDNGVPSQTSETTYNITVIDQNDNAPQFTKTKFTGKISESSKPSRYVSTVAAYDIDLDNNSEFHFNITDTIPNEANGWFDINPITGDIYLVKEADYSIANGKVELVVTATDHGENPLSNTITVEISVLSSITFQPNSFQEYSNVVLTDSSIIYLELRTDRNNTNALLLYQYSTVSSSITSLQIIDNKLVYTSGDNVIEKEVALQKNKWYSLLINKNNQINDIQIWERNLFSGSNGATQLLQTSVLTRCSDQLVQSVTPLYVGGVQNIFNVPEGTSINSYDFNGEILAIIIDQTQLDMSCPFQQNGVLDGSHLTHLCTPSTNPCNIEHSSCVSYTTSENTCHCNTGFPSDSCDDRQDFGNISLTKGSHIEFDLGYDYFVNTQLFSGSTQNISISIISATERTIGVLFSSKTTNSIQRLEIDQTIRYTITTMDHELILTLISEKVTIIPHIEYTLTMELLDGETFGRIAFGQTGKEMEYLPLYVNLFAANKVSYMFAKQPRTRISVGGMTGNEQTAVDGDFNGCITKFSINQNLIPLNNLIRTGYQNLTIHGHKDNVSLSCHHCYNDNACPENSNCEIIGTLRQNEFNCHCQSDYELQDGACQKPIVPTSTLSTAIPVVLNTRQATDGIQDPTTPTKLSLNVIISITGGGLLVIVIVMVLLVVIIRCAYVKGKKKHGLQFITQVTYHQNNAENNNNCTDDMKDVIPSPTRPSNNYVKTTIKQTRHSSSSDNDSAIDGPHSPCSYRKSTSQETGFHTASEFDTPSRQSSPRRVYDCGKSSSEQYDSDIETDSESLNTSGIEECLSPHNLRLLNSNSIPSPDYRKEHRLSSKERIMLTPLHPNSSYLLTEDETASEISTTTNTTNRQVCNDNDSIISDLNGPKWYKSSSPSTIVSNDMPTHYSSHTLDSYKRSAKRRIPPANFRPHKSNSPPHYYVNHNNHSPLSSSPLVQKAHRFDYPPYGSGSPSNNRVFQYMEPIDHPLIPRLPAINESDQYIHHSPYHIRQHSDHSYINMPPLHHDMHPAPYYPGYQGTNLTPGGMNLTPGGMSLTPGSTKYCDLNSFAQVNPITYWEQQQRLHPTVDDGLHFLTEAYTKFEDVSTTPSVVESTVIDGDDESVLTASEFGGLRRPMTSRGSHNEYIQMPMFSKLPRSRRNSERDSVNLTGKETSQEDVSKYPITHFPSADCCTPTFINDKDDGMLESTSTLAADTTE